MVPRRRQTAAAAARWPRRFLDGAPAVVGAAIMASQVYGYLVSQDSDAVLVTAGLTLLTLPVGRLVDVVRRNGGGR